MEGETPPHLPWADGHKLVSKERRRWQGSSAHFPPGVVLQTVWTPHAFSETRTAELN